MGFELEAIATLEWESDSDYNKSLR